MHSTILRIVAAAALFAAIFTGCLSTRPDTFEDSRISDEIAGALHGDHIDGITVDVAHGRVRLSGSATPEQIARAVQDAERADGVRSVKNAIRAIEAPHGVGRINGRP